MKSIVGLLIFGHLGAAMLVQPVFRGSYERLEKPIDLQDHVRMTRDMIAWRWDLGRTIDYLATRPDVDVAQLGYVGLSMGGSTAVPLLAVESRIKAAVLQSGGIDERTWTPFLDPVNYAPRIHIPVLMMNGRYDEWYPVAVSQEPLLRLLGTARADKKHVLFDTGHGSFPRAESLRETLGWYDRYLGAVRR